MKTKDEDVIIDEMWCSKCDYVGTELVVYHSYDKDGDKLPPNIMCGSCFEKIRDYEFKIEMEEFFKKPKE